MEQVTPGGTVTSKSQGVWASTDFRHLWSASTISQFGSNIGELALPLLAIITMSASPAQVGLLRTAQFLPFLLLTLPLGVAVDRLAKRPLMLLADLGRCVLVGAIPILVWVGIRDIRAIYTLVFLTGCLTVLYQLADFALLPSLVSEDLIIEANGKLLATASASEIAGTGLGGVIVDVFTAPIAVLADSVTYLFSAIGLWRISARETIDTTPSPTSAFHDARQGLVVALRNPYIRPLLGEATTFNFFDQFFIVGLLLVAVRHIGLGAASIGAVFVAGGIGSLVGAWFGARVTGRFGYGRVLLVTMLIGNGAPVAVIFLGDDPRSAMLLLSPTFLLVGLGTGIANVHGISLRQTAIPADLRGRVNAGYRLLSWGAVPLGASLAGMTAGRFGANTAMVLGALGIALSTLWVAASTIPTLTSIEGARATTPDTVRDP
ncbi:MAG: MFS transporter [Actinobacteria bacterium]|nr:MFS transporter [Actinomycetota bacterium]